MKILAASPLSGRTETRVRTLLRGHWHSYPGDVENVWQEFQKTSAPTWLHLADDHINTVIAWISSSTWDESRQYLAEHSGLILDDMTSVVLDELALMAPAQLIDLHQNLLYSIREYGADAVYRQLVLAETADQWMAASDWDASRAFIEDHPELLSDSMTAIMGIKADTGDPTASVHNALLTLARGPLRSNGAYQVLQNLASAQAAAASAIVARDTVQLSACADIEERYHHHVSGMLHKLLAYLIDNPAGPVPGSVGYPLLTRIAASADSGEVEAALAQFAIHLDSITVDKALADQLRQILSLPGRP